MPNSLLLGVWKGLCPFQTPSNSEFGENLFNDNVPISFEVCSNRAAKARLGRAFTARFDYTYQS